MKKNNASGFTLIEVMIALAIISISLTAVIKATSQNIKDTIYLQNKMTAHWVGMNVMNQVRVGLLKVSSQANNLEEETEMLGSKWAWTAYTKDTPNPQIKEIHVEVVSLPEKKQMANLMSFLYAKT
jgi:general secretion pathway protein I